MNANLFLKQLKKSVHLMGKSSTEVMRCTDRGSQDDALKLNLARLYRPNSKSNSLRNKRFLFLNSHSIRNYTQLLSIPEHSLWEFLTDNNLQATESLVLDSNGKI